MKKLFFAFMSVIGLICMGACSSDVLNEGFDKIPDNLATRASSSPNPYQKKDGDAFAKAGLSQSMSTQMPNTCVTSIMEYANNKVFGGSTNEGTYILYYLQTYGKNVITSGVDLKDIKPFVEHFFNTTSYSSYKKAVDNGHVVMTDITSSIPNSAHNVLVLGYQLNNDFVYMDPEKGSWYSVADSYFLKHYNIELTGIK